MYKRQDNTKIFEVPAGHYFMMGDNRDNSTDSRADPIAEQGVGYVPEAVSYTHLDVYKRQG